MANVTELSDAYANFMLGPLPGPAVCELCFDLTGGHLRCYGCAHNGQWLDLVAPISYSVAHEQLHHALAGYKRPPEEVAKRFEVELAAVLWRHLAAHEQCVALATGVRQQFDLVTTVPSSSPSRAETHPLCRIVGELCGPTRDRYERLLLRTNRGTVPHTPSLEKFEPIRDLDGANILLIDDTWTTGANAQSAASALKSAGARKVAAVVIGRHLHRDHGDNNRRLRALLTPFQWDRCAVHKGATPGRR